MADVNSDVIPDRQQFPQPIFLVLADAALPYGALGTPVDNANPIPVSIISAEVTPKLGAWTDRSGTVLSGGAAQQAAAANATRRYLFIQNTSDTDLWFNIGVVAVAGQPSIKLATFQTFTADGSFIPTGLVSVIGATTGKAFTAKEG